MSNKTSMKRYFIKGCLLIIWGCSSPEAEVGVHPTVQSITESVYASVKIYPDQYYYARTNILGTLSAIWVEEGQKVEKDQPLFAILPSALNQSRLVTAQINLEEAKEQYLGSSSLLGNLEKELANARNRYQLDSLNFVRQANLQKQNIGKKIDYDASQLQFKASKNQLQILEQQYQQREDQLKRQYEKANNQWVTEKELLSDYTITSKINGLVYSISKEIGDLITAQDYLAEIGSEDEWLIEMEVDEVDVSRVGIGDTVAIILEAYPNQTFRAITEFIAKKKNEKTQTFRVTGTFIERPPQLYSGLSGEANIIVGRKDNSLVIPAIYLSGSNKVLTTDGEKTVVIGVKNLSFVEIISGLDTADVLLNPVQ
jgi:multidrug efflux pump subunit AcrA (membrane-fusion protein)